MNTYVISAKLQLHAKKVFLPSKTLQLSHIKHVTLEYGTNVKLVKEPIDK